MTFTKIIGTGGYLPARIITNDDLSTMVDTSDEWIQSRTGIKQRHFAEKDEQTSDMALQASIKALKSANINANDLDGIIVATCTGDHVFPSTAAVLQHKLGITKSVAAFDVQTACSGFVYGFSVANGLIRSQTLKTILLVGAEKLSKLLDFTDRSSCVLFGDGAGAVVLTATDQDPKQGGSGILSTKLYSKGSLSNILYTDVAPKGDNETYSLHMNGREVFKVAVNELANAMQHILEENNISEDQLDWLIPHQANKRIITALGQKLGLPPEKVLITVEDHANTSAASVPLALDVGISEGKIKQGQMLLLEAIGGGMSWASALLRL